MITDTGETFEQVMDRFLADNGQDWKLIMDQPLNSKSIMVDLGSYIGDWSFKFYNKFGCYVDCYEPIKEFHDQHVAKINTPKIKAYNYALETENGTREIYFQKDGSSFYIDNSAEKITVQTCNINEVFKEYDVIDLLKMNIEGSEYDVLNSLHCSDEIKKIKRLLIQFHDVQGFEEKYKKCLSQLEQTHKPIWQYWTIWQLWELK